MTGCSGGTATRRPPWLNGSRARGTRVPRFPERRVRRIRDRVLLGGGPPGSNAVSTPRGSCSVRTPGDRTGWVPRCSRGFRHYTTCGAARCKVDPAPEKGKSKKKLSTVSLVNKLLRARVSYRYRRVLRCFERRGGRRANGGRGFRDRRGDLARMAAGLLRKATGPRANGGWGLAIGEVASREWRLESRDRRRGFERMAVGVSR